MGTAETAGIVIITVAIIQGLIGLIKYLLNRQNDTEEVDNFVQINSKLENIDDKIANECGLNDKQSNQLYNVHELITKTDGEGRPLIYFPFSSYTETQKEIAERLQTVSEVQLKMLGIIERLEKRIN